MHCDFRKAERELNECLQTISTRRAYTCRYRRPETWNRFSLADTICHIRLVLVSCDGPGVQPLFFALQSFLGQRERQFFALSNHPVHDCQDETKVAVQLPPEKFRVRSKVRGIVPGQRTWCAQTDLNPIPENVVLRIRLRGTQHMRTLSSPLFSCFGLLFGAS